MKRFFSPGPLLFLVALAFNPGCSCNGNGHVAHNAFVAPTPDDDVINCACNITFAYPHCDNGTCLANFQVELCMPLFLQSRPDMGPDTPDAGAVRAQRIDDYCRHDVTNIAYHLIKVFNGSWCGYKSAFAPDGGVGQSVECFAHEITDGKGDATRRDDGTCKQPCPRVKCQYEVNCGEGVQDAQGGIHIDKCQCNQVIGYGCPGDPASDLPTSVFCRPPDSPPPQ